MIKTIFQNNKPLIFGTLAILIIFGAIAYKQNHELNEHGIIVEGTIVKCQMVKISGACVVDVEYTTVDGFKKTSTNTLYWKGNCQLGKKVRLQYSNASDLTHVIEEEND